MIFKITAVRNGAPVLFNVDGSTKEEAFATWKASAMSAGCTRATADYDAANVPGLETRKVSKTKTYADRELATGNTTIALVSSKCQVCGVTTLFNQWDRSLSRVHRVGCTAKQNGDFVTSLPLGN